MPIRLYDDADREGVLALWKAVLPYDAPHNDGAASIDRKLRHADGLFWVATARGKIIGTVMAGYDGHRGWIYSLAVAPDHRGKGLGAKLLRVAEKTLVERGAPKINLQLIASNHAVVEFYRRAGYRVEERISMGKIIVTK